MAKAERGAERPKRAGWAALVFFLLLPPAAGGGGLAVAPLQALAGLSGAPWKRLPGLIARGGPALAALGVFWLWCFASTFWSVNPDREQVWKLLGGLVCGLLFVTAAATADPPTRRLIRWAGVICLAGLGLLLAIEALFSMPINRIFQPDAVDWVLRRNPAKGAVVLVIVGWGVAAWALARLTPWRVAAVPLGAVIAALLGLAFHMDACIGALVLGVAFWALGLALGRAALILAAGLHALAILGAPALAHAAQSLPAAFDLPFSWNDRIRIWKTAADEALKRPLSGFGMDSARLQDGVPLHPHYLGLQIWLELGAIGAALAAAATMLAALAIARALTRAQAACAAGLIGSYMVFAHISFGAWQEWWIATAFIGAALIAAAREPVTTSPSSRQAG